MPTAYQFGRVEVDPANRRLLVDGSAVPLGARAFDLLLALIERPDRLVPKDELLAAAWPGVVVEENNLQVQVSTLRKILGAGAIVTVQGRGYRFALEANDEPARDSPRHNLQSEVASFVGRERELSDLEQLLAGHRLVTLTGIGGIGKTRLALRAGAAALAGFPDGVWFADLSRLSDPRLVADAAAAALAVQDSPGTAAIDRVRRHAASKRLLLILDNCEHLLQSSAELADAVLKAAPDVKILATSREPLHVAGEAVLAVPTLAVPEARVDERPQDIEDCAAVRLFVDRASSARADFSITPASARAVARICRDLDGIPLALELAAARVRTMPVAAIAERLANRFKLLTAGVASAMPRQQTLRAAIDWSHDLLIASERAVLRRVAVFSGGFVVEAAEAVAGAGEVACDEVLDIVGHLVDKSLVVLDADSGRYRLLETVRQYALARLGESGEEGDVRLAHMHWYAGQARRATDEAIGPRQAAWQVWLGHERENLLLAHANALAVAEGGDAALAIAGMLRWLPLTGHESWYRVCEESLAHPGAQAPTLLRVRALVAASFMAYVVGRYAEALVQSEEAVRIADAANDDQASVEAHVSLGGALLGVDSGRAREHMQTAYDIAHRMGDGLWIAIGAGGMGEVFAVQERYDLALPYYVEYLALGRTHVGAGDVANGLFCLVLCAVMLDDRVAALVHLREAIPLGDMKRSARHAHIVLASCMAVAALVEDWNAAARLYGAMQSSEARHALAEEPSGRAMFERSMARLRAALDPAALEAALSDGRALDDDAAQAEALAWLEGLP